MKAENEDLDLMMKIVTIGESGVGKTNIVSRYVSDEYSENTFATVGIDFNSKTIEVDGSKVCLQIWDTAGQERMRAIASAYYRNANGALLIYDISSKDSFDKIAFWLKEIRENGNENLKVILLGNKSDLDADRQVPTEVAKLFAKEKGYYFMEVSAKTNSDDCVSKAFAELVRGIMVGLNKDEFKRLREDSQIRKIFQVDVENSKKNSAENMPSKNSCCKLL